MLEWPRTPGALSSEVARSAGRVRPTRPRQRYDLQEKSLQASRQGADSTVADEGLNRM